MVFLSPSPSSLIFSFLIVPWSQSSPFLPEEQTAFHSKSHWPEVWKSQKEHVLFISNSQRHADRLLSHTPQSGVMYCITFYPYPGDENGSNVIRCKWVCFLIKVFIEKYTHKIDANTPEDTVSCQKKIIKMHFTNTTFNEFYLLYSNDHLKLIRCHFLNIVIVPSNSQNSKHSKQSFFR